MHELYPFIRGALPRHETCYTTDDGSTHRLDVVSTSITMSELELG